MPAVKVCHCCLSADRKLGSIGKHVKLYLKLLLTKENSTVTDKEKMLLCWECHKILDNIQAFRLRITKAQKVLNDKSLVLYSSLSTLTSVELTNDTNIIIHDDMKDRIPELEIDVIKEEKHEEVTEAVTEAVPEVEKDIDIKEDNPDAKEPLKVEAVKDEDDGIFADGEMVFDIGLVEEKEIKKELDQPLVDMGVPEKKVKFTRNRGVLKKKYRTIIMNNIKDKRNLYDKVKIDEKGLAEWMEKKKKSRNTKQFQCERCFCGFSKQKFYDRHLAVRHSESLGEYECDICGFRFPEKHKLAYHVRAHFVQFVCRLCAHACAARSEMYLHFAHGPHGRQQECKKCGLRFDCRRRREFFDHYRYMHETHICDHCGRNFGKKNKLVAHIHKHHTIHRCKLCNVTYSTLDSYTRHHRERHVVDASEHNYCVECNMQFINSARYNVHLKRSVRHRPNKAFPCQECGKVYTKHCSMVNHYNLVHLKKSKYHCVPCDTYASTTANVRTYETMPQYAFKNCGSSHRNTKVSEGISFFSNPFCCAEWISTVAKEREEELYRPYKNSTICSIHLDKFDITGNSQKRRLQEDGDSQIADSRQTTESASSGIDRIVDVKSGNEELNIECTPPEILIEAQNASNSLLTLKSKDKYMLSYTNFIQWKNSKNANSFSENVFMAYFNEVERFIKEAPDCQYLATKYFLTGYRLRYHQKYFHEKRPKPKNKLCKFCGKGFTNNRMLDNHVRTHTGERPFACTLCSAAFTQKQSLSAHTRSAHKLM